MNNVLDRKVLTLNRTWQLIGETSVQLALVQLAGGSATALDIRGDEHLVPVRWEDWLKLEPLNDDEVVRTQRLRIRMPTVIICLNYAKVPKRRPKFNLYNIAQRDGFKCQYTGRVLSRADWSMDHVLPLSRGGEDAPDNVVLAAKDVNNRKGGRTPEEAGLPSPKIRPLWSSGPRATHPHHEIFLKV